MPCWTWAAEERRCLVAHVGREGRDPTWERDSGQREGGGGRRVVGAAPGAPAAGRVEDAASSPDSRTN